MAKKKRKLARIRGKRFKIVPTKGDEKRADIAEAAARAALQMPPPVLQEAINAAIDADRIKGFMLFVRNMPTGNRLVMGTSDQARSIARALEKLGY